MTAPKRQTKTRRSPREFAKTCRNKHCVLFRATKFNRLMPTNRIHRVLVGIVRNNSRVHLGARYRKFNQPVRMRSLPRNAGRWIPSVAVILLSTAIVNPGVAGSKSSVVSKEDSTSLSGSNFLPTVENKTPAPGPIPQGMVWIPGGEFSIGSAASGRGTDEMPLASNDAYPVHRVRVDGFWMDATPVTNEQFE